MKKLDLTTIYNNYKGLWVILDKTLKKVIVADRNAKRAYEKALKKGLKKPTLFKVPRKNIAYFGADFV